MQCDADDYCYNSVLLDGLWALETFTPIRVTLVSWQLQLSTCLTPPNQRLVHFDLTSQSTLTFSVS